ALFCNHLGAARTGRSEIAGAKFRAAPRNASGRPQLPSAPFAIAPSLGRTFLCRSFPCQFAPSPERSSRREHSFRLSTPASVFRTRVPRTALARLPFVRARARCEQPFPARLRGMDLDFWLPPL